MSSVLEKLRSQSKSYPALPIQRRWERAAWGKPIRDLPQETRERLHRRLIGNNIPSDVEDRIIASERWLYAHRNSKELKREMPPAMLADFVADYSARLRDEQLAQIKNRIKTPVRQVQQR